MNGSIYLADAINRFREAQSQCDRALAQVPFEQWNHRIDPESNSVVTLILHLSGNMLSRWTDFLSTDGEKTNRIRDAEFEDPAVLSEPILRERWANGWTCLFNALSSIREADLPQVVTIRAQSLTVTEAINRQMAHYAYHSGQLVFLCKHLSGKQWRTLSIPRAVLPVDGDQ